MRVLPGGGPEWDRLARAALAAGEPVGLVMINGQQVRGWVRDGLLADLGADPQMADVLARVPDRFQLGGSGEDTTRAFPLALTRGIDTTGMFYNKALLDRASLRPPGSIDDLKAMVEPLAALGVAPLVHCSGDVYFNQMLVTWLLPMIAERAGDPISFVDRTIRGRSAMTVRSGSRHSRRSPTCELPGSSSRARARRTTWPCSSSCCRERPR